MAAIDVNTIKHTVRAWVIRGSALADDHVIWTLGKRAPSGPYIHLRLKIDTIGQDLVRSTPNPTPTSGNDATYTVVGSRLVTLTITCYSSDDINSGARSVEQILNDVLTAASLPSVSDSFRAAKIGSLKFGTVESAGAIIDTSFFEPRAVVTVTFHTVAQMSETGPAIDSVTGIVGTTDHGNLTFDVG